MSKVVQIAAVAIVESDRGICMRFATTGIFGFGTGQWSQNAGSVFQFRRKPMFLQLRKIPLQPLANVVPPKRRNRHAEIV